MSWYSDFKTGTKDHLVSGKSKKVIHTVRMVSMVNPLGGWMIGIIPHQLTQAIPQKK